MSADIIPFPTARQREWLELQKSLRWFFDQIERDGPVLIPEPSKPNPPGVA